MPYAWREVQNNMTREEWNQFVVEHKPPFGGFLQSWEWGEFQSALGRRIERIHEAGMAASAIQMDLPLGQYYWYMPKGPIGSFEMNDILPLLREKLGDAMFLRMEPDQSCSLKLVSSVQPRATVQIDLNRESDEILASMKSKTRYNIRLGARKGVETRFLDTEEYIEDFLRLMDQTRVRDGFSAHAANYYKALLDSSLDAKLVGAFFEDRPIAMNIILDFAGTRTYLHGATSNLHRNVMAQYVLHHFLIEDARARGMNKFDFWGVAPEGGNEKSSWSGITRYKMSFGGNYIEMPGTYDLAMKQLWYGMYRLSKKLRGR